MMIILTALIAGVLLGFYGRKMYDMVYTMYSYHQERRLAQETGVVTPRPSKVTRNQPLDVETDAGSIMRPSPQLAKLNAMEEREFRAKHM